jgi:hypothetical protein
MTSFFPDANVWLALSDTGPTLQMSTSRMAGFFYLRVTRKSVCYA